MTRRIVSVIETVLLTLAALAILLALASLLDPTPRSAVLPSFPVAATDLSGTPEYGSPGWRVAPSGRWDPSTGVPYPAPYDHPSAVGSFGEDSGSPPLAVAMAGSPAAVGSVELGGVATYFAYHEGQAAAGPALRDALGSGWRGQEVTVCAHRCITVTLTGWCACGERAGKDTLLDLDRRDFARLASLSSGVVAVTVEIGGVIPLPATDVAP